jgi:ABC-type glycerol-3-phosphate transport system substrate-binding protein
VIKHAWLAGSVASAALLLSACGGASSTPAAPPSPPLVSAPATSPSTSTAASTPKPSTGVSVPADSAAIGDSIQYDDKVEVTITQFENAGDHTTLTVEIDNKAAEELTGPVDVQASYGSDHLASTPVAGATPISLPIQAGKKASGKYTFTIPKGSRNKVAVDVALGSDRDHAQFLGSVK